MRFLNGKKGSNRHRNHSLCSIILYIFCWICYGLKSFWKVFQPVRLTWTLNLIKSPNSMNSRNSILTCRKFCFNWRLFPYDVMKIHLDSCSLNYTMYLYYIYTNSTHYTCTPETRYSISILLDCTHITNSVHPYPYSIFNVPISQKVINFFLS